MLLVMSTTLNFGVLSLYADFAVTNLNVLPRRARTPRPRLSERKRAPPQHPTRATVVDRHGGLVREARTHGSGERRAVHLAHP